MKTVRGRSMLGGIKHYAAPKTDEGLSGLGEAALNTRQIAADGGIRHPNEYLRGRDPMRSGFLSAMPR